MTKGTPEFRHFVCKRSLQEAYPKKINLVLKTSKLVLNLFWVRYFN